MKTFLKTLLASSVLVAAGAAHAANINVSINSDAGAAEAAFLGSLLSGTATETFDDEATNGNAVIDASLDQQHQWRDRASSYSTDVGTFTLTSAGQSLSNPHNDELMIEGRMTGEFGRQILEDGDYWLDSNDAREVVWTLGAPLSGSFNAFGFQLADASDISANLTLSFSDGSSSNWDMINYSQPNGNLKYVTVTSDQDILGGTLTFSNSTSNDGWGVDNITVGTVNVPEPGSLLLMGLGMLGLGAARRRTAKKV